MFKDLSLQRTYNSDEDDIYNDFYIPVLKEAVFYRRMVGYYSVSAILNMPSALSNLVENQGNMQLIIGQTVSEDDFDLLINGYSSETIGSKIAKDFQDIIDANRDDLLEYRLRVLSWLFVNGHLEVKFGIRPNNNFHTKIGLLLDKNGDGISFSGSVNETLAALKPECNFENLTVFRSWLPGQKDFFNDHKKTFDKLWTPSISDVSRRTLICDIPDIVKHKLRLVMKKFPEKPSVYEEDAKLKEFIRSKSKPLNQAIIPKYYKGEPFELRDYQRVAQDKWHKAHFKGILALCTGAGKTLTALNAVTNITNAYQKQEKAAVVIIIVPGIPLADEWLGELSVFGVKNPIKAWSEHRWYNDMEKYVSRNESKQHEEKWIVVVKDTFKSGRFQNYLNELKNIIIIGDECHHYGHKSLRDKFPEKINYRLGLSATPWSEWDDNKNKNLKEIFGDIKDEITISEAIHKKILTKYEYIPIPVLLTPEEEDEYSLLSKKIGILINSKGSSEDAMSSESGMSLMMARSRILSSASGKLTALKSLIDKNGGIEDCSLVYCGDGKDDDGERQMQSVAKILMDSGIEPSPYTSNEHPEERMQILDNFKNGTTKAIIAINCLDEGVNIPNCRAAYFMSSARVERQFIQRRGRVLRKADGKDKAMIYDFVTVLPLDSISKYDKSLFEKEFKRVVKFANDAINKHSSLDALKPWIDKYKL